MPRRLIFVIALAGIFVAAAAAEPPAAELRNGRWQPLEAPTTRPVVADPVLDQVERLLTENQASVALKLCISWIKTHARNASQRDRACFLMARIYYQIDSGTDRVKAFYYLDEVMDEYPDGKLFYPALEMQYQIANEFLNGHELYFLVFPYSADDYAIEMLYRIQQRSPGSPLAEKALLRTADYYYSNSDYDLAHDAYDRYWHNYPRSPMVATAMLREAFSSLAQFRGIRFDPTTILDARTQLLDIMTAYPDLAREENLAAIVAAIDDTLSAKLYVTADYYRRTHEPAAAVYMYRYLIETYPNAAQVPAAQAALSRMPQWALDQPSPLPGSPYMPGREPQ
jgi:outer membrane assembly lipoprotein YfiO